MRTAIVYNFLLEATIMASIAIVLMIPIRRFLREGLTSRVLCFGWLLTAIRLLCPFTLPNPVIHEIHSPFVADEAIRPIAGQIKVRLQDAASWLYGRTIRTPGASPARVQGVEDVMEDMQNGMLSIRLMQLYGLVVLGLLLWFGISNLRFRRRMKANRVEALSGETQTWYEAFCRELGVKPVPVWYVDPLPSACLVGVWKPCIALPLTAGPEEAMQVLQHELCHYAAKDHWWGVVRLACCAVHWFNPLVWLAARTSRTDMELACDERVTEKMNADQKKAYAGVLLQAAAKRSLPGVAVLSTGMSMTGRVLKTRVGAIMRDSRKSRALALAFVLLSAMALVGAFATSEMKPGLKVPSLSSIAGAFSAGFQEEAYIARAREVWQTPGVLAETEGLVWRAQRQNGHVEVIASTPQGEDALAVAFLEDGRLIYLACFRSGPTESLYTDNPRYENDKAQCQILEEYGRAVIQALNPGMELPRATECQEGVYGEERSLHFLIPDADSESGYDYIYRVRAFPQVQLIYFIDNAHMSTNDADRLEPGNG